MSELLNHHAEVLIVGPIDENWVKTRDRIVSGLRTFDNRWSARIAFCESFQSALVRIAERDQLDLVYFCIDPALGREHVLALFWEVADVVAIHRDNPWIGWQASIEGMVTICYELKLDFASSLTIAHA